MSEQYILPSTIAEALRLERQGARLYGGTAFLDQYLASRPARVLDVGCGTGLFARHVAEQLDDCRVIGVDADSSRLDFAAEHNPCANLELKHASMNELPFDSNTFDLVYSNLDLHWVNDLPGALLQIRRALRPDGLFLAAMLGGATLNELRAVLTEAEDEIAGGAGPRVSPFAELRDAGGLLQRAGFALPVADADEITVTYDNLFRLMADLRGMAETNAVRQRRKAPDPRALFLRAAELYAERHAGPDGRIPATFEVIYLHGWAPHESQPRALRPGAATARLADALDATERPAGETAAPDRTRD